MPRKSKNTVVELEDSDVESIVSQNSNTDSESNSDSDTDSVSSEEEVIVKKATKTSQKKTKKETKSKIEKDTDESENEENNSIDNMVKVFEKVNKSFSDMTDTENPIITKFVEDFMKLFIKTLKALNRSPKKEINVAQVQTVKTIKSLEKQKKKKTTNRKKGGFTQAKPVPIKLCKFLGIPVDSELARSEVTKMCYAEFKKRKMNIGNRKYKFDKDSSKVFGKDKDEEFHIHSFQGILAAIYNECVKETL